MTVALVSGAVALRQAFFPTEAAYLLDAKTERIVVNVPSRAPKFGWSDLQLLSVDDKPANCAVDILEFGSRPLTISMVLLMGSKVDGQEGKSKWADASVVISPVESQSGEAPWQIACKTGTTLSVRRAAVLVTSKAVSAPPTFTFFGDLEVGGLPDSLGSQSKLLQAGELRASGQVRSAHYSPAFNKLELFPGDELQLRPRDAAQGAATFGVIRVTDDAFHIVAHAADAVATLRRLGRSSPATLEIMPSPLAVLQANPTWGVLSLGCTLISALVSMVGALRRPDKEP